MGLGLVKADLGNESKIMKVRNVSRVAGEEGFEPSFTDSESAVLPLDYSPAHQNYKLLTLDVSKVSCLTFLCQVGLTPYCV